MTQPAPGAQPEPTTTTTPAPTPQPPAPTRQPTTSAGQDPNEPIDFDALPPAVKQYIGNLRKEAGGRRQETNQARQERDVAQQQRDAVLQALGLNPDGTTAHDPAQAAAQLSERATQAENAAWGSAVKLEVFQRAAGLGANPTALLDSLTFVDSLDELTDADPNSAEFRAALEAKITAAVQANPNLKAASAGPPARSGGDFSTGGDKPPGSLDEQIAAAQKAGNWRQVISLQNQKLLAAKQQ